MTSFNFNCLPTNMVTLGVRSSTYEEGGGHIHPIIEIFLSLNLVMEQYNLQFSSVQFSSSVVSNSLQPHELQHDRCPCHLLSRSFLKLMSIESVMPSNHLILCHPLFLLSSIFPSIRVFFKDITYLSNGNTLKRLHHD